MSSFQVTFMIGTKESKAYLNALPRKGDKVGIDKSGYMMVVDEVAFMVNEAGMQREILVYLSLF